MAQLQKDKAVYKYLKKYEDFISGRSLDRTSLWYAFGRTQGIKDVVKERIAINTLIRDINDIKIEIIEPGCGVYSGLYILTTISPNKIISYIKTDEFVSYISLLGKYKSGGYYTFSSKDIKKFLIYKL